MNTIRHLLRRREDKSPYYTQPDNTKVHKVNVTTTTRHALPADAWFDAR